MEGNYAAPQGGIAIILNESLTEDTRIPARRNKKRRIQKKWLKRYGYRKAPDKNIYYTGDKLIMHPETFRIFSEAFGGRDAACERLAAYYKGGETHE